VVQRVFRILKSCLHGVLKFRTEALALVRCSVDVDFGADYVAERYEHLSQLSVAELLR
jgi:hypothetical protein